MKFAAFLLLWAVQVSPIPRKAPNPPANTANSVQNKSENNAESAKPNPIRKVSESDQHEGQAQARADENNTVIITSNPQSHKDGWDKVYIVGTWALVIIGAIGVRFAYKTLKAIQSQVEIQRESLRSRLMIGGHNRPFEDMIQGNQIRVDVKFINTGGIPAYGVKPETWLEFLDIPFPGFTSEALHQTGGEVTVHPHQSAPFAIPFNRALTPAEITRLDAVTATLYLRVRLLYKTIGEEKFTDYTFQIAPTTMNIVHGDSN
jgi:hypothetical protein